METNIAHLATDHMRLLVRLLGGVFFFNLSAFLFWGFCVCVLLLEGIVICSFVWFCDDISRKETLIESYPIAKKP